MPRKPPAASGGGIEITPELLDAVERARVLKMALRAQPAPPPPVTAEQQAEMAAFERTMSLLDRQPSADERQSAQEAVRRQAIYRQNVANGFGEWRLLLDDGDEAP